MKDNEEVLKERDERLKLNNTLINKLSWYFLMEEFANDLQKWSEAKQVLRSMAPMKGRKRFWLKKAKVLFYCRSLHAALSVDLTAVIEVDTDIIEQFSTIIK